MCHPWFGVVMDGYQRNFFTLQEAFSRGCPNTPDEGGHKAGSPCQITHENDLQSTFNLTFFLPFPLGGIMNAHCLLSIESIQLQHDPPFSWGMSFL